MNELTKELVKGLMEVDDTKVVALYGGGFKPPIAGHFNVVKQTFKEYPEIDELKIFVGGKERDGIDQEEALLIWDIYKNYLPSGKVTIEPASNPIGSIYSYSKENLNDKVYWILGRREGAEDDNEDIALRQQTLKAKPDTYPNLSVKIITTSDEGMRGRNARKAINNREEFFKYLPDISIIDKEKIYDLVSPKLNENITKSQLDSIESYADGLFNKLGIDIDFTKHFFDRLNDIRNKKPISVAELIGVFKKLYKKHGKPLSRTKDDLEAVVKDFNKNINIPFVIDVDQNGIDMTAKTIMRKQDFQTTSPIIPLEEKLTQEIPEFFYHATYKALLPSIEATGLDTREVQLAWEDSKPGIVYLANDPAVAESYAEASDEVSDEIYNSGIVILKVASKDLDLSKLKDDSNVQEDNSDTYEYYGQIPWNKLSVTNLYDKDNLNENTTYANYIDYKQQIKDLTKHMLSLDLNITPLPKVIFKHNDVSNAKDFFGKTAYYVPSTQTIVLYTEGRHPKDVARSFSHEMIHHIQNLEGRLGNINTTNTNEDEELDMIESEAYLRGNMIFRNWTDSIDGEITTDIEEGGSLIPIKIKKPKPDPFGINAYARELATGLEEAFLNEGKYDSLITKLAGYTLNAWKGDFEDGQNEGKFELEVGPGKEFDYPYLDFNYKAVAKFGGMYYDKSFARPLVPEVIIKYFLDIEELPRMWEQISMDLRNTIRHEIEHLMQSGPNVKKGKEKSADYSEREEIKTGKKKWWKIWRKTLGTPDYYKLEKEVDANLQGLYLKAKKSRTPLKDVIDNYVRYDLNLPVDEQEEVKRIWRERAPKLNIPLEEEYKKENNDILESQYGIPPSKLINLWKKETTDSELKYFCKRDNCGPAAIDFGNWAQSLGIKLKRVNGFFHADKVVSGKRDFTDQMKQEFLDQGGDFDDAKEREEWVANSKYSDQWKFIPHYWLEDNKGTVYDPVGQEQFIDAGYAKDLNPNRYSLTDDVNEELNEGPQFGVLYHYTSYLIEILNDNQLGQTKGDPISLTRSRDSDLKDWAMDALGNKWAILVLDKDKLRQNYKITPYKDPEYDGYSEDEMEEQIQPPIKNLNKYLVKVILQEPREEWEDYLKSKNIPYEVEGLNEGDTYEKMAAKGKKAGNLKQGTVRKRLGIKKGEKVPMYKINKELARLRKMDKDKDKKGVQLGDKNQKYYKALQLSKTLKTTTNVNEADPKKGTGKKPKGSGRRLYTDENPKDTVKVKFSTRQDIVNTLNKKSFKSKPHARQSQVINLIHQRVRAALGRAKDPKVKKRLKTAFDYIKGKKEASKKKTERLKKQKQKNENIDPTSQKKHKGKSAPFGSAYKLVKEDQEYTIYSDMDGVLVDFNSRFKEFSNGIEPQDYVDKFGIEAFWKLIDDETGVRFWIGMNWMPDGKEYWNYIKKYNPKLLSAPSRKNESRLGKRIWAKRNLPGTKVILAYAENKKNYANANSILIDDMEKNIEQWRAAGGIGILHTSAASTIAQLKELGL